jgi:NADP-dependent 3-hydroxy acid dehydrogenase YdfG
VLPNAGISEVGLLSDHAGSGDRPTPPDMTTLEVDLIGVLYTTRLALWHFEKDTRVDPGLQCVCFTGSLSTFYGANNGPMYGASKAYVRLLYLFTC